MTRKGISRVIFGIVDTITLILSPVITGFFGLVMWSLHNIIMFIVNLLGVLSKTINMTMTHLPKTVGKFIPKKAGSGLNQQLIYAGVEMTADEVISITLVYSVVVAVIAYLIAVIIGASTFISIIVVLTAIGIVWALPFIFIGMLANNRTNAVEETLPDVLSMVAQNMKAGMTSYNALWSAARPEFGPLAIEIQDVAKATLTGIPLTDALVGMTNHVKSAKLPRSVRLIVQGMKSGGDLPAVLMAITTDMRKEQNLKKQMAAETSAQTIFILFAIMIGAPLLFSVSFQFINIFSTMMTKLNVAELSKNAPQAMVSLSPMSITPQFFQYYAIAMLTISGVCGSLLIGILKTGSPTSGIPSVPSYVMIPILMFIGMKYALGLIFGSMISF